MAPAAARRAADELNRGQEPVAGGGQVAEDDMARLLPAQHGAGAFHGLDDMPVADRRADDAAAGALDGPDQAVVAHDRNHQRPLGQGAVRKPLERADAHHPVPVDDVASLADRDEAVGVAVEGETHVQSLGPHQVGQAGRVGRAAADVDIRPIGIDMDGDHLRTEIAQEVGPEERGGSIGSVHADPQALQRLPGDGHQVRAVRLGRAAGHA